MPRTRSQLVYTAKYGEVSKFNVIYTAATLMDHFLLQSNALYTKLFYLMNYIP